MKRSVLLLSLLSVLALIGTGVYLDHAFKPRPSRITTGPFKLVLAQVSATAVRPGKLDTHDTDVTVTIDYQGPKPSWWGKAPYIPDVQIGSSGLVDEHGKTYHPMTTNFYNLGQTFDPRSQQCVWTYYLHTAFVPGTVHHLTFKSQIIHPTGTLHISAPVRNLE